MNAWMVAEGILLAVGIMVGIGLVVGGGIVAMVTNTQRSDSWHHGAFWHPPVDRP